VRAIKTRACEERAVAVVEGKSKGAGRAVAVEGFRQQQEANLSLQIFDEGLVCGGECVVHSNQGGRSKSPAEGSSEAIVISARAP
jgi:hypothetical protein